MAKKNSFIVHLDSLEVLDELGDTDKEKYINAGKLLFAWRDYHIGKELNLDTVTRIAFVPFKNQFERDGEKYDKIVERNRRNGQKGGRKPKTPKPEEIEVVEPETVTGEEPKEGQQPPKPPKKKQEPKLPEIPTYEEFEAYALSKASNLNKWKCRLKYDSWVENKWKDGRHKPIKNWKTKLLNTLQYIVNEQTNSQKNAGSSNQRTAGTYSRSQAVNSAQAVPRKDN